MLFKKSFGELVQEALGYLKNNTTITNTNVGGITRSLIEVINKNISEYYDVLDTNMTMGFLSSSQGYYLDLIGSLFNMPRTQATLASSGSLSQNQKFYVATGVLLDKLPGGFIPASTTVSTQDGTISYYVSVNTNFLPADTEVYVPLTAVGYGEKYNVSAGALNQNSLGVVGVFTTNVAAITNGLSVEGDSNYKYRLMNATLSAEKANEVAVRLAALSVDGVANATIRPYARGIGTFDVIVTPVSGIANSQLLALVQTAIDSVQSVGMKGTAIAPSVVPVDLEIKLIFTSDATDFDMSQIRSMVTASVERYIVNIPIGGTFILNELRQQIMDVSTKIKDHVITCYIFRNEPTFIGNVDIYWDEMFYPNPSSSEAIRVT
jgi:uncharacterized phage protein gp47/JayE